MRDFQCEEIRCFQLCPSKFNSNSLKSGIACDSIRVQKLIEVFHESKIPNGSMDMDSLNLSSDK